MTPADAVDVDAQGETGNGRLEDPALELEHLYRTTPVGVALLDRDLRYVRINDHLAQLNGHAVADHIGRTLREMIPDLADDTEPICRKVIATGRPTLDVEISGKTSADPHSEGTWLVSYRPLKAADGTVLGVSATVEDITARRQAQDAARESKGMLHEIADAVPALIAFVDRDCRFRFINQGYQAWYGVSPAEAYGKHIEQVLGPANFGKIKPFVDQALRGEPARFETTVSTRDGPREVDVSYVPRSDDDGAVVGFYALVIDATSRKRAERALKDSETRHRTVLEDITEMIARSRADGTCTYVNEAMCRYFGRPAEDIVGTNLFAQIPEKDSKALRAKLAALTPEAPVEVDEYRVRLPDGRVAWHQWVQRALFDEDGRLTGYQGVGRDITERKRAADALRESEARFRSTFENSAIASALAAPDGRYIQVNRAMCDMLGYTEAELLARTFYDVTHPDDREDNAEQRQRMSTGEIDSYELVKRYLHKDGRVIWALVNVSVVRGADGKDVYTIAQHRDITARKLAEEALRESEARFRSIFESSAIPSAVAGPDCRYSQVNQAMCDMLGYAEPELLGRTFYDVTHPDDREGNAELWQRMSAGEIDSYEFEKRYLHKDGRVIWAHINVSVVRDADGHNHYAIGQLRDITARKIAEQKVEELLRFERMLSRLSAGFVNLPAADVDKQIQRALQEVVEFLGVDRATLAQLSADGLELRTTHSYAAPGIKSIPTGAVDRNLPWYTERARAGEIRTISTIDELPEQAAAERKYFETQGIKSALSVPLEIGGRIIGAMRFHALKRGREWPEELVQRIRLVGEVFVNTLARKRALEEILLRTSAIEAANDGIVICDARAPDMPTVYVSRAFEAFTGYEGHQICGRNMRFMQGAETDPAEIARIRRAVTSGEPFDGEILNYRKDGTPFWNLLRINPVRDAAGQITHFVGVSTDITERKQAEARIEELLRFERLLSQLSATFVNLPADQIDAAINEGLGRVGVFMGADRCFLDQFSPDKTQFRVTHLWTDEGFNHEEHKEKDFNIALAEEMPWYTQKMRSGEPLVFSGLDELPEEAVDERAYCRDVGIQSSAILPLLVDDDVIGNIGLDAIRAPRAWSEDLVQRLRLAGEVFANALARTQAETELRTLSGRLMTAQEDERWRIARELHDDFGQRLALLNIGLAQLTQALPEDAAELKEQVSLVSAQSQELGADLSRMAHQLHPAMLEHLGLLPAVRSLCKEISKTSGIEIRVKSQKVPDHLPAEAALALYRVLQEALQNMVKHSGATEAEVSLRNGDGKIQLSTADNGDGFDPTATGGRASLGLASMRERLRLVGGDLTIQSKPGAGARIIARVPVPGTRSLKAIARFG